MPPLRGEVDQVVVMAMRSRVRHRNGTKAALTHKDRVHDSGGMGLRGCSGVGVLAVVTALTMVACGDLVIEQTDDTGIGADATPDAGGESCTSDADCTASDVCFAASCVDGTCEQVLQDDFCFVEGLCYADGQEKPGDRCQVCDPQLTQDALVNRVCPDGGECVDGFCTAGKKPAGEPCVNASECETDACVPHPSGMLCGASCSDGAACVEPGAQCVDDICYPSDAFLCRPCSTDAECQSPGSPDGLCVSYPDGAGSFCGLACTADTDCPTDFACTDTGNGVTQCTATSLTCSCNPLAIADGASTSCGQGACAGVATCGSGGLGACDGGSPAAAETCDGLDDDCDGETDEDFIVDGQYLADDACGDCSTSCIDAVTNGTGACALDGATNQPTCVFGTCDAGYVQTGPLECSQEQPGSTCTVCSTTGDCDPGLTCTPIGAGSFCTTACTSDIDCNAGFTCADDGTGASYCMLASGGCAAIGSSCSVDTDCENLVGCQVGTCDNGSCAFAANDAVCDDTNACTTDLCGASGCVNSVDATATTCDDGDPCTLTDTCNAGTCSGTPLDCSSLDTDCEVGVCMAGTCTTEAIPCSVTSFRYQTASWLCPPAVSGGVTIRATVGTGLPAEPAANPTGIKVRWGLRANSGP